MVSPCQQVDLFFDGELPDGEAESFREHLGDGCRACDARLGELFDMDAGLRAVQLQHGPLTRLKPDRLGSLGARLRGWVLTCRQMATLPLDAADWVGIALGLFACAVGWLFALALAGELR